MEGRKKVMGAKFVARDSFSVGNVGGTVMVTTGLSRLSFTPEEARWLAEEMRHAANRVESNGRPCDQSPTGLCQLDTTMESGPNNCFYCDRSMRA